MRLLFTDTGQTLDGQLREAATMLHAALDPRAFRQFAVINLGYIMAAKFEDRGQVWFRPSNVTPAARGAFFYWASTQKSCDWLISTFEDRWVHSTTVGFSGLRELVQDLVSSSVDTTSRFSSRELRPHDLPAHSGPSLLLSKWGAGELIAGEIERTLDQLNGRYLVAEFDPLDNSVTLLGVGSKMLLRQKARGWCDLASGIAIEDHPDQGYGTWVANSFRNCARLRRPSVDEVKVTVTWPKGTTSHVYRRTIAPVPISDGRVLLISSSHVDESREIIGGAN